MWDRQGDPARLFQVEFSLRLYMIYKVIYDYKELKNLSIYYVSYQALYRTEQEKEIKAVSGRRKPCIEMVITEKLDSLNKRFIRSMFPITVLFS